MSDDWQDALTPFAREVIASAEDDACDDGAFERMNKKVVAAAVVAASTGAAASAAAASTAAGTAAAATASLATKAGVPTIGAVFFKLLAAVAVGSTVVGGVLWSTSEDETTAVSAPTSSATPEELEHDETRTPSVSDLPETQLPAEEEEEAPASDGVTEDREEEGAAPPRRPNARVVEERHEAQDEAVPAASLGDELRLLRELSRSVQTRPAHAVRLAEEHEARFGESDLGPERELHRIRALIVLARDAEAARFRDRFHVSFPSSPYGPRVDALITGIDR